MVSRIHQVSLTFFHDDRKSHHNDKDQWRREAASSWIDLLDEAATRQATPSAPPSLPGYCDTMLFCNTNRTAMQGHSSSCQSLQKRRLRWTPTCRKTRNLTGITKNTSNVSNSTGCSPKPSRRIQGRSDASRITSNAGFTIFPLINCSIISTIFWHDISVRCYPISPSSPPLSQIQSLIQRIVVLWSILHTALTSANNLLASTTHFQFKKSWEIKSLN